MTKKLTGRALARFEAGRYIWQEVLDGVREIRAGRGKRTESLEARPGAMRARTASTERRDKDVGGRDPTARIGTLPGGQGLARQRRRTLSPVS